MLNPYNTSYEALPTITDYLKDIYSVIRGVKSRWRERWELDHTMSTTTTPDEGHKKLTMKGITPDAYEDGMPAPMNWETGVAEVPDDCLIIYVNGTSLKVAKVADDEEIEVHIC